MSADRPGIITYASWSRCTPFFAHLGADCSNPFLAVQCRGSSRVCFPKTYDGMSVLFVLRFHWACLRDLLAQHCPNKSFPSVYTKNVMKIGTIKGCIVLNSCVCNCCIFHVDVLLFSVKCHGVFSVPANVFERNHVLWNSTSLLCVCTPFLMLLQWLLALSLAMGFCCLNANIDRSQCAHCVAYGSLEKRRFNRQVTTSTRNQCHCSPHV